MNELRKITKAVRMYEKLLSENENVIKENLKICTDDLEIIATVLNTYIDNTARIFQNWCDINANILFKKENNIFLKMKRSIKIKLINYKLKKINNELSIANIQQYKLNQIWTRISQFQYFL